MLRSKLIIIISAKFLNNGKSAAKSFTYVKETFNDHN